MLIRAWDAVAPGQPMVPATREIDEAGLTGGQALVQDELTEVIREIQHTARCQTSHGQVEQLHMVALHIEDTFHTLGVGEGRRIDKD